MRRATTIRKLGGSLLPLLLCSSAPQPGAGKRDTVTVSVRTNVCAGMCPNYDVSVDSDGQVTSKWPGIRLETLRFRVSAAEAARFRSILHGFRRAAEPRSQTVCVRVIDPLRSWESMGKPTMPLRYGAVEIGWRDPGASEPLVMCDVTGNIPWARIEEALGNVHLSPLGSRIDERAWRRCHAWICYQDVAPGSTLPRW
jgi:hypothetical protein